MIFGNDLFWTWKHNAYDFRELYFIFKNAVNMHLLLLTSNMGHDDDDDDDNNNNNNNNNNR